MKYDITIIGNGIAANCLLYHLSLLELKSRINILHIYPSPELDIYNCSFNSMATVSLSGVKKDVSLLGDILLNSFNYFIEFKKLIQSSSITQSTKLNYIAPDDADFVSRYNVIDRSQVNICYEDIYLIDPVDLIADLKSLTNKSNTLNITVHNELLQSYVVNKDGTLLLNCHGQQKFETNKIALCTGMFNNLYSNLDLRLNTGIYFTKNNVLKNPLPNKVKVFAVSKGLVVYKEKTKQLMVSGESNKIGQFSTQNLYKVFNLLNSHLGDINLGQPEEFDLNSGIRAIGKKMLPTFNEIHHNVYCLGNLGKNGFLFSPYLSKQIASKIINAQ